MNKAPLNKIMSVAFLLLSVFAYSAPPGGGPPPPTPPPPPGLPIDNGIIFLFILATMYGLYKVRKVKTSIK